MMLRPSSYSPISFTFAIALLSIGRAVSAAGPLRSGAATPQNQVAGGPTSFVYWTEQGFVKRSPIDQPAVETLILGLDSAEGVDANVLCEELLFWTDDGTEMIGRSKLDGSDQHLISTLTNPQGIAAHPRTRTVYWSVSAGQDRIYRANFDFSNPTIIIPSSFDVRMGRIRIAGEKLYWVSQHSCQPSICNDAVFYRSDLNGSNIETLFVLDDTEVVDFFVDAPRGKLYWTTRQPNPALFRGNPDGSGAELLRLLSTLYPCVAQEPVSGRVVWTDGAANGRRIFVGDVDAQNPVLVAEVAGRPGGLSVVLDPSPLTDCNENGEEDLCELTSQDCQQNGIPDSCDIAVGFSEDCDSNDVPDECDIAEGTSTDANDNGIPDECDIDIAPFIIEQPVGVTPCGPETVVFSAVAGGMPPLNYQWRKDTVDLSGETTDTLTLTDVSPADNGTYDVVVTNGLGSVTSDQAVLFVAPLGPGPTDPTGFAKSRFISMSIPGGRQVAIRVTLTSLHHVVPVYPATPSIPFTAFEGQIRWVGPPVLYQESTADTTTFMAARLQCQPYYQDWSTVGLVHVMGSAIVPSSVYDVQTIDIGCQGNEAICQAISCSTQIKTSRWGDVTTPFQPPSTTTQPNLTDLVALVDKFKSAPGALSKVQTLLVGDDAFGNFSTSTMNLNLGFSHISADVNAFAGYGYPHTIQACP